MKAGAAPEARFSREEAWDWQRELGLLVGCNYVTSTAVNAIEMWQEATFDPATIERELGFAADAGMNACRVFLHEAVHSNDPAAHLDRFGEFLDIAASHGIGVMPVLFDDVSFSGRSPVLGPQPDPVPGVHNSGWVSSPGYEAVDDLAVWPRLRGYVEEVLGAFSGDPRVVAFDLYNEPGNFGRHHATAPFLDAVFDWAQAVRTSQPLTVGAWFMPPGLGLSDEDYAALDSLIEVMRARSDVVSFHSYDGPTGLRRRVAWAREAGRPVMCTEWLMRASFLPDASGPESCSRIEVVLPYFASEAIGSFMWGLVRGRIQTHYPWLSRKGSGEPDQWFHDLLEPDGSFHDPRDAEVLKAHSPRTS